jgi:hypothetical protein
VSNLDARNIDYRVVHDRTPSHIVRKVGADGSPNASVRGYDKDSPVICQSRALARIEAVP